MGPPTQLSSSAYFCVFNWRSLHCPTLTCRMARSVAPEIWGLLDVKKALLLALVGGCTKHKSDGMP